MQARIDILKLSPAGYKALLGLEHYLNNSSLEKKLLHLIKLRVSQINGCAYCLDMHWKDLQVEGESEQRMYSLDAWREAPYYTERERAALAWAEAVTNITGGHVPDELYEETRKQFSEQELADLTLGVITINGWNRLSIAFRVVPGTYQPPQAQRLQKGNKLGTQPGSAKLHSLSSQVSAIRSSRPQFWCAFS